MKNKLLLDKQSYQEKPKDEEIRIIQNTIYKNVCELTVEELLNELIKGKTFKASYLTNKSGDSFVSSSLICIDVDNKGKKTYTFAQVKECLERYQLKVAGAYTTFTHTEKKPKFRVILQLDQTITLLHEIKRLYAIIKGAFEFQDAKISPTSLFFGGKELLYCDAKAITRVADIYKIYEENKAQSIDNNGIEPYNKKAAQSYTHLICVKDCDHNPKFSSKPTISMLKDYFFEQILKKFHEEPLIFDTFEGALTYAKKLPLHKILGVKSTCYCMVHDDNHQSGGIFQYEDGTYHFHCFSCGAVMDIIDFLGVFLNLDTQKDFIKLCNTLNKLLNIRVVNSEWKQNVEKLFTQSKKCLKTLNKYQNTHPKAVKVLEYGDPVYRFLVDECLISLEYVPAKDQSDLPLTRASLRYIASRTGLSLTKVRRRLEKLQQANFIRQLSDEETKRCSSYFGKTSRVQNEDRYTINTYAVNFINNETINEAEACMIRFKESGATMRSMCAKQSKYIEGNNDTCIKSTNALAETKEELKLIKWAERTLKRKKCFLKEALIRYGLSLKINKYFIERCITKITHQFKLRRCTVSNAIIKIYNLPKNSLRKILFYLP